MDDRGNPAYALLECPLIIALEWRLIVAAWLRCDVGVRGCNRIVREREVMIEGKAYQLAGWSSPKKDAGDHA